MKRIYDEAPRPGQAPGPLWKVELARQMRAGGYSPRTIGSYFYCVDRVEAHWAKALPDVTASECREFLWLRAEAGDSPATLSVYRHALRSVFGALGLADRVALVPRVRRPFRVPRVLDQSEVRALLDQARTLRDRTFVALVYSSGLRLAEALALRVEDLDFLRRQIHVRSGKGGRERYSLLAQRLEPLVRAYLAHARPEGYLFFSPGDRGRPLDASTIQRRFQTLVGRAGLRRKATVHSLRHTFATHLLEANVGLVYIMRLLGHASIQSTMVYLHVRQVGLEAIASPFDGPAFGAPAQGLPLSLAGVQPRLDGFE